MTDKGGKVVADPPVVLMYRAIMYNSPVYKFLYDKKDKPRTFLQGILKTRGDVREIWLADYVKKSYREAYKLTTVDGASRKNSNEKITISRSDDGALRIRITDFVRRDQTLTLTREPVSEEMASELDGEWLWYKKGKNTEGTRVTIRKMNIRGSIRASSNPVNPNFRSPSVYTCLRLSPSTKKPGLIYVSQATLNDPTGRGIFAEGVMITRAGVRPYEDPKTKPTYRKLGYVRLSKDGKTLEQVEAEPGVNLHFARLEEESKK